MIQIGKGRVPGPARPVDSKLLGHVPKFAVGVSFQKYVFLFPILRQLSGQILILEHFER